MAITGTTITPKWTYSTNAGGDIVLPPESGILTYKITVQVDAADNGTSGTVTVSALTAGLSVLGNNPVKLNANGRTPFAYVRFQAAPDTATQFGFTATPLVDKSGTTGAATPLTPVALQWLGAGVLYPTLTANTAEPDDIPALDTSDQLAQAQIAMTITDNTATPIAGVSLSIGPSDGQDITGYTFTDLANTPLQAVTNGISTTGGPSFQVTTAADGQAGIKMSCPVGSTLSAQAGIFSWGAQLLGGDDALFFASDDVLFVGPVNTYDSLPLAEPIIFNAQGSSYVPPPNASTCELEVKANWINPNNLDRILLISGSAQQGRPRKIFSVDDCDFAPPLESKTLLRYPLDIDRLVSGNIQLRFLTFRGTGVSPVAYSQPHNYSIGALPAPVPLSNVNRALPQPRLFVKSVSDTGDAILDRELFGDSSVIVNWEDIRYGGLYVYIPYAATEGSSGMSGDAWVKIYRNGIYRNQEPEVSIPKTYAPVQVTDTAPALAAPAGSDALTNGILMLIPTSDLSNWNAPREDGIPRSFLVEYWDSGAQNYSAVWKGAIDTVPN